MSKTFNILLSAHFALCTLALINPDSLVLLLLGAYGLIVQLSPIVAGAKPRNNAVA